MPSVWLAPWGAGSRRSFPSLTLTTAHVIAFLAIVLLVGLAIDLVALFLTGAISLVPVVGGLNRVGGLLAGAALGVLVIWLLTACLLLLPPTLLPFTSGVRRSETAQLVRNVPTTWSRSLRTNLLGSGAPARMREAILESNLRGDVGRRSAPRPSAADLDRS